MSGESERESMRKTKKNGRERHSGRSETNKEEKERKEMCAVRSVCTSSCTDTCRTKRPDCLLQNYISTLRDQRGEEQTKTASRERF